MRASLSCIQRGSQQRCQSSPSHRLRICTDSHHKPLASQLGSSPYLYWSRSLHQGVTSLGHQDHCNFSVWPLRASVPWSDSQFFISSFEQDQYVSSCLSIFNYHVKLHYITCTKNPTPAIARGCACSIQFHSTNIISSTVGRNPLEEME